MINSVEKNNEQITMSKNDWDVVITPRKKITNIDFANVWRYKDLIWVFFMRDFTTLYKQTILGPIWYLIQPIITASTYYIVFGKIAKLSTNGLPPFLFYMSGIILWTYFSSCLNGNSEVFSKNANLFGKVYFPRLVVPISVTMTAFVAFCIQFLLIILVLIGYIVFGDDVSLPGWSFLAIPFLVLYVGCLGLGVGLIISALTVRFRDLVFVSGFAVQLWMYASPLIYALNQIPTNYHWFFYINPMTAPLESMRNLMFGSHGVPYMLWLTNAFVALVIAASGLILFTRAESNAMDTV